ncbi:TPA: MATE family efflux transporter [Candidatus Poribacteria bacterium]|jgi:putative MATE family efflux protein|nr:MATE family efflux transporter [Candidatus Poribacteria bacterium]HIC00782.1 MATE family efflux transporter [Candidatus Poribacteria bacterium]HIC18863.1 MATE family efflux transporter [Candidatus Poribacteria bacterium]HIN28615.1 MATE family efflux transporter [Candidatus Poribacteria bacterium]HIO06910.1 MATE family efflux transporter [Candidatus Poribacteria bacterium]
MQQDNRDLTTGKITQNLVYLAIPILMTYILQDAFEVIDMIFIGQLGSPKLAAVAMSGNILRLVTVIGLGISTGATVVVSQSIGAKKQAEGENIALQSLLLSVFFSVGICGIGYPLSAFSLRILGAAPEIVLLGVPYMQITFLGLIMRFLSMTLNSIYRGAGDAVTPMLVLIFATVLNIILDWLLIFGKLGFPELGIVGSAYATVIGRSASVLIMLYICFRSRGAISLKHADWRINLSEMGKILKLGIFSAMQGFWRHLSRLGFLRVVASYGTNAVAAYAICMRLRVLVMTPGFAIAGAVSPMVGQNLGARLVHRARKSAQVGNWLAIFVMIGIGFPFLFFPEFFVSIFTQDQAVIRIANVYLRYLSPTFGFIAMSLVLGRAMTGSGDTLSPMAITLVSQCGIGLMLVIVLSHTINIIGIWLGIALSNVVQGILMWIRYKRSEWETEQ